MPKSFRTLLPIAVVLLASACETPGYYRANGYARMSPMVFTTASGDYELPPKLLDGPTPIFPPEQRLNGQPGKATVAFTIGIDGRAQDVSVRSASEKPFGDSMLDAVRAWTFEPARANGAPVPSRVTYTNLFCVPPPGDDCHAL